MRTANPLSSLGVESWSDPLRKAALEVLQAWRAKTAERSVLEESFDRTATVRELALSDPQSIVWEKDLARLPDFPKLEKLTVMIQRVTNAHLALIAKAKGIVDLDVGDWSEITDAGLPPLVEMPRLRTLNLNTAKVTDAGLATLGKIESLRHVSLVGTKVTAQGVAAFRHLRPEVEVSLNSA